jgi:hypothetical protein
MRICKPNEAGLILGMGSPSMMNWSGTQFQSPLAASTNPTPAPSTPNVGSVSPISPGFTTVTNGTNQFGDRTITVTETTYGGSSVGPGSSSATDASSAGAVNGSDSMSDSFGGSGPGGF